ncbi:uncharacterized protein [Henckelia pumila]|uniref:uncharacterized protein n=1 Tax=Henckelia pumila TaxID=405737 RepID=UPI003C6E4458
MNLVADVLSQKVQNVMLTSLTISKVHEYLGTSGWTFQPSGDCFIVSSIQVEQQIISDIKTTQRTDPYIQKLKELSQSGKSDKFAVALYGILHFRGRFVVPNFIDLKEAILREAHCNQHIVHPGNRKMYHGLRSQYWWKGMKKEISDFVAKCLTCQQVKAERMRPSDYRNHPISSNDRTYPYKKMAKLYIDNVIDGQSERTIQTLKDMLRVLVMYFSEVGELKLAIPKFVQEMKYKVALIRKIMKAVQDRQSSYANKRRRPLEFQVGDYVFLKVSPFHGTMRFGRKGKLAPRYIGPYVIFVKICVLDYRLDMPQNLSAIHDVFNVSMMRKYEPDPSHILRAEEIELDSSLSYCGVSGC